MNTALSSKLLIVFRIIICRYITDSQLKRIFTDNVLFVYCIILYTWIILLINFSIESTVHFYIINLSFLSCFIPISLFRFFINILFDKKVRYFNFSHRILNIISNFCLISIERPLINWYSSIAKVFFWLLLLLLHFAGLFLHITLMYFSICHERFWSWR